MHKIIISIILLFAQQLFTQNFTIIGIPDTQFLVDVDETDPTYPLIFDSQTQWIVDQKDNLNIVYVAHFGDVVQHGSGQDLKWQRADYSMSLLEDPSTTNLAEGIPYGVAVGNHDQSGWGNWENDGTAKFNEYFGISRFNGRSYYGVIIILITAMMMRTTIIMICLVPVVLIF